MLYNIILLYRVIGRTHLQSNNLNSNPLANLLIPRSISTIQYGYNEFGILCQTVTVS